MTYQVRWTNAARKDLKGIPKKQRLLLVTWVRDHLDGCENPRGIPQGKQLQGTKNGWRWRIGSYRVIGQIKDQELVINLVRAVLAPPLKEFRLNRQTIAGF